MRPACALILLAAACSPSDRGSAAAPDAPAGDEPADSRPVLVDTSRVYAHSGTTLYHMNSVTLATTAINEMTGLGDQSLTDLAIDKDDNVVGITLDKLYSIDVTTGDAALIAELDLGNNNVTSLSYIPEDLADPQSPDMLVAASDQGKVFRIDPATGDVEQIGDYGTAALGKIRSSGDLFAVRGLGVFASVDVGTGAPGPDFLATIDPSNGWKATLRPNDTGFDRIFGIGFWGGVIYGFIDLGANKGGAMIQIDANTGVGTELSTGDVRWFGAGVATDAPILL